jgi:PAS domain S-box-containing protein
MALGEKMKDVIIPTDTEVFFAEDDIIVSKTDLKGRITYANRTFCEIAGYTEADVVGQPHSMIRHPDMPRAIFKLLWDTLTDGREIFAYVKNMTRTGDYYWVFAHVTPSYDASRNIIGFHSNRRVPNRDIVARTIAPLYAAVAEEERKHKNGKDALAAGFSCLTDFIKSRNMTYDALMFSL